MVDPDPRRLSARFRPRRRRPWLTFLGVMAPVLTLFPGAACERPPPTGNEDPDSLVVYLTVDAAVVAPGDTLVLEARGRRVRTDPDARFPDAQFTSLTPAVAAVNQDGRVVAQALGTAVIEGRVDHEADTALVAVRDPHAVPQKRWRQVDAGQLTTCAIDDAGRLYCWGDGFYGTVGTGARRVFTRTLAPMPVEHSGRFAKVSVGDGHACAVTPEGILYCWGENTVGELGTGEASAPVPYPVAVLADEVADVVTGANFTCALDSAGRRSCWGSNLLGQLGIGTTGPHQATPIAAPDTVAFTGLSVGSQAFHACGLHADGTAYCWGSNAFAEAGVGSTNPDHVVVPTPVSGGHSFSVLEAGDAVSCGISDEGVTSCWGFQGPTFLGREDAPLYVVTPQPPGSAVGFVDLAVSAAVCALTAEARAYCWGWNYEGQLGAGEVATSCGEDYPDCSLQPLPVDGHHTWADISASVKTTCGITIDGALYCWGSNQMGQLGTGDPMERSWTPVRVADPVIWP